jgi:hypothetical protein
VVEIDTRGDVSGEMEPVDQAYAVGVDRMHFDTGMGNAREWRASLGAHAANPAAPVPVFYEGATDNPLGGIPVPFEGAGTVEPTPVSTWSPNGGFNKGDAPTAGPNNVVDAGAKGSRLSEFGCFGHYR